MTHDVGVTANQGLRPQHITEDPFTRDLVFLPSRRAGDGSGVYDEGLPDIARDLAEFGVSTSWADADGRRLWEGKRAFDAFALEILVGICSAAAYDALLWALGRVRGRELKVTMGTRSTGDTHERWVTAEGSADEVVDLLKSMNPWGPSGEL